MTWLGDNNPFSERFPSCDLNEKQVRTLIGFSDIIANGLGPSPAIRKLTDCGIVEINVQWARRLKDHGSAGTLWLGGDGTYIASAVWEGAKIDASGPVRVYRWLPIEGGWRRIGMQADEITYPESGHRMGSTQATREFIKEHWMEKVTA